MTESLERETPWTAPTGTAGLIFDCDGTLADTMPTHYRSWLAMLDSYGIPFPEDRFYSLGGMPTDRIIEVLAREAGVVVTDIEAMTRDKEERYLELLAEVQPVVAVRAVAERHRNSVPMAVASGGQRYVVERTLRAIGVHEWFAAIVGADDTERHKPEPDVFLLAAHRIGAEPARCVVFEDTELGLEAARRAGMTGIDVRPWYPRGA